MIGLEATPHQLTALAALPMQPVAMTIPLHHAGAPQPHPHPVRAYATPTPGLLLQRATDIGRTNIDPDGRVSYDTTWTIIHHSGHLLRLTPAGGPRTYPHHLDLARRLGATGIDWTRPADTVSQGWSEQMSRAYDEALLGPGRLGSHENVTTLIRLVGGVFHLDDGRPGWDLTDQTMDLISDVLARGWTPRALAGRLTHTLRTRDTRRAAFTRRLRTLDVPADVEPRPVWCMGCDPGTRLVRDERGWVTACPDCHTT